jgi:hypothetical protein
MNKLLLATALLISVVVKAQQPSQNLIIITTDGLRWQEIFKGMDSSVANDSRFNEGDSDLIFKNYWSNNENERRKKLMPFLWSTIGSKGQVWGNREFGNKIDNANRYWFSYPGYNEIMTGFPDTAINRNSYPANPHVTVLEFLNKQKGLKGQVAAFGAWNAFDRILNKQRAGFPIVSAFDPVGGKSPNANEKLINAMNHDAFKPFDEEECLDVFTQYAAMEYLKTKKPRVLYIAYGETDEWAHAGHYRDYLNAAHQVDAWIKEIWDFIQKDPQYKNKTTILFTTDHGRGAINKDEWTSHNNKIQDAHEIWFGIIGPFVPAKGELKTSVQLYQQQFAQTIARLLGFKFKATHPIADEIKEIYQ